MNDVRDPEHHDDELLAAYRRASAGEARRPDQRVRERVMAQVRREHAPAAANQGHWSWRAAAGIAVIGLVGLLATRSYRSFQAGSVIVANRVEAPAAAAAPAADVAAEAMGAPAATARVPAPAAPAAHRRVDSHDAVNPEVSADKSSADTAYRVVARGAPLAADASEVTASVPVPAMRSGLVRAPDPQSAAGRDAQVRRAVIALYSRLFLPADAAHLNLLVVLMNDRGQIERAVVESVARSALAAGGGIVPERFQRLGLAADDISASGYIELSEKSASAGAADNVLVVQYCWPRSPAR